MRGGVERVVPYGRIGAEVQQQAHRVDVTAGSVAAIPYPYQRDAPAKVKAIVTAGAGTGKL